MPIIAKNFVITGNEEVKEEPVVVPPPKPIVEEPKVHTPKSSKNKFKKENDHGVLLGVEHAHSAYLKDMLTVDTD